MTTAMLVTVTDAASGLNVCDASVVASDGTSTFGPEGIPTPEAGVTDASCAYAININGAATKAYRVSVTAPGYKPGLVPKVNVAFDDCVPPKAFRPFRSSSCRRRESTYVSHLP